MLVDIKIGKNIIGENQPTFIIAEAGVNHNGDIELAKKLIIAAKHAGADCVKFQTFTAENVVTKIAPKAEYQLKVTDPSESQVSMLKKLELPSSEYPSLIKLCEELDIMFLSTPYNFSDVDLLESCGVVAYKLASIHCTELPMVEYVAKTHKPLFLSTGLATLSDVVSAAKIFRDAGNDQLVLLQCTTDYPARPEETNLRAMYTIQQSTGAIVGYSDNSGTTDKCIYAVAAGAKVVEKHFTLDKNFLGPDHSSSANPEEFSDMVKSIRMVEIILGDGEKKITPYEKRNQIAMKRSLVSTRLISSGTVLTKDCLTFKRPATGLAPNAWYEVIGKRARVDIPQDTTITRDMVKW